MKKILLVSFVLLSSLAFGQKAVIEFEEKVHNFGEVAEKGGLVDYDFVFKNVGDAPLILTNVRSSCGCTTPSYPREPVAPQATGVIKVVYNPSGRPGNFSKTITVTTNAQPAVNILTIKGNVVKKPVDPYAKYTYSVGDLKLKGGNLNFGDVLNTAVVNKEMEMVNTGDKELNVTVVLGEEPYITAKAEPSVLKKGEKGKITVTYDFSKKKDWGFVNDKLLITTSAGGKGELNLTSNIKEDFSTQKAENYVNSPVVTLSQNEADVKTQTEPTKAIFYIENTGKSTLYVRKITSSNPNITADVRTTIKAGKKQKATISVNAAGKINTTETLTLITNDPKKPEVTFKLNFK
ncbi:MAG: DUF1573 domain-containing protein [Culturomica sp.]|jgi:hypothetical protein|nr:DUF1573 domain-containing protein [Culturomica sp.]